MGRNGEGRYLLHVLARPWFWGLIGLALVGAVGAYQVRTGYTVDVGAPGDALYVRNFYASVLDPDGSRTYRRTDVYSYVAIPGVGGGAPYSVTLTLNPGQTAGPETIILNGEPYLTAKLPARWQTYTFAVDAQHPQALAARDLVVELRAPPTGGLEVAAVTVGPAGPGLVVPPILQLAYLAALLVLGYLFAARVQVDAAGAGAARPEPRLPLLLTAAGALLLLIGLATVRLLLAALMLDLVLAILAAHVLLAPAWWAARQLAGEGRIVGRLLARPAPWLLAALTVAAAIGAWQVRHSYGIDVGSPADQAYTQNFHDRVVAPDGRTYRTSDAYGYVVLPGIGGGVPYSVTLTVRGADPGTPLTVIANGVTLISQRPLTTTWETIPLSLDATHPHTLAAHDLVLEIRASRASGVDLDRVTVGAPGPSFITPSWADLADLAALVLLVYLLAGRALSPSARAPRIALGVAAIVAAAAVGLLALVHLPLTVALPHLVTTALLTYVLLLAAEWAAARLAPAPPIAARGAALLVAGAFLMRYGAMALPESVIIDMPYHMKWMHELLAGNIAALTDPHGGLNAPPDEWNLAVIIPKSPLFYFAAAPLAWLPGDLETAIKALVCLLEASTVLFCYALAARFGRALGGWRVGLAAGAVYAVMPLSFRALAYGILPTILAQWLSVAFFTGLLYWLPTLGSPAGRRVAGRVLAGLGLLVLLAAALIAFPTIAVFDTIVLGGLVLTWLPRRPRRSVIVAGLLGTAWVGAIGIYYGVYLVDLLTRTLPELLGASAPGGGSAAPAPSTVHWTGPLDLLGWTLDYLVSALPLILGVAGLAILWGLARRRDAPPDIRAARPLAALTAWWVLILPVFLVANYRFDMIGKHLYFTMVPLALGSGFFLDRLARRGPIARRWAGLLLLALAFTALLFWATRLVQASS